MVPVILLCLFNPRAAVVLKVQQFGQNQVVETNQMKARRRNLKKSKAAFKPRQENKEMKLIKMRTQAMVD